MERLSTLDAEFLLVEDGIAHMHIAGISVFDGPRPAPDELASMVAAKLHRIPRYRQRVRRVPFELGRPVWVDDPHIEPDAALPDPDAALPDPEPWTPAPEPSGVSKVLDAWTGAVNDGLELAVRAPTAVLRDPGRAVAGVVDTGRGLFELVRHLGRTTPTTLEGAIGPHRRWAYSVVSLEDVRSVRRHMGATINDVVLAVLAGAFRELLLHRGEDADTTVLRTLVPVSVRTEDARSVPDNRVSAILFELPVHLDDPVARVEAVKEQMAARKASHMSQAGEVVVRLGDLAPPMVVGTAMRTATRLLARMPQRSVNTVTTNVPGPQVNLYCLGRPMVAHLPFVPLSHGVRIGVAILSYDGNLAFGVTGDRDTAADVDVLADAAPRGLDELLARL
jgi:diacylglycerol O-acyltransferase